MTVDYLKNKSKIIKKLGFYYGKINLSEKEKYINDLKKA
jgi:hypothetical protein